MLYFQIFIPTDVTKNLMRKLQNSGCSKWKLDKNLKKII